MPNGIVSNLKSYAFKNTLENEIRQLPQTGRSLYKCYLQGSSGIETLKKLYFGYIYISFFSQVIFIDLFKPYILIHY